MESRSVQEASEDVGNLFLHDSRAVVLDDDQELVLVYLVDFDEDVRKDLRLFAGVQTILDSLFDGGQGGLRRRIVAENVVVKFEDLGDADLPLLLRELFGDGGRGHAIPGKESGGGPGSHPLAPHVWEFHLRFPDGAFAGDSMEREQMKGRPGGGRKCSMADCVTPRKPRHTSGISRRLRRRQHRSSCTCRRRPSRPSPKLPTSASRLAPPWYPVSLWESRASCQAPASGAVASGRCTTTGTGSGSRR